MNCSHSMTAADWIAEQRRIAQAATEGPWEAGVDDWNGYYVRTPWKLGFGVAYVASLIQQGERLLGCPQNFRRRYAHRRTQTTRTRSSLLMVY